MLLICFPLFFLIVIKQSLLLIPNRKEFGRIWAPQKTVLGLLYAILYTLLRSSL